MSRPIQWTMKAALVSHGQPLWGHAKIVRMLLDRVDLEINFKDKDGYTPMALAARRGHSAVFRALVERKDLDRNSRDDYGWTPLMLASVESEVEEELESSGWMD
ncbi:uncharacterized protein N7498_006376 [Penicillium cinerascens]|uniref:Ankyrin n=1 Tax=Penicillium cinerascens TaxID=70096 RepID=A0A9W9MI17_9EURO|nr:uncharacterized protein N7498_006376 [Penicillium cinerascens]KAJ5201713.1 hypothetical protein N7498_006376 [Penicillium cinerascens]